MVHVTVPWAGPRVQVSSVSTLLNKGPVRGGQWIARIEPEGMACGNCSRSVCSDGDSTGALLH